MCDYGFRDHDQAAMKETPEERTEAGWRARHELAEPGERRQQEADHQLDVLRDRQMMADTLPFSLCIKRTSGR